MEIERYATTDQFCQREEYLRWRDGWSPPRALAACHLNDSLEDFQRDTRALPDRLSPRELWMTPRTTRMMWYLADSIDVASHPTVDLGCGSNLLASHYHTVTGVDPHDHKADQVLTPEWYPANWGKWHRAISICALHFIHVDQFTEMLDKMSGILRPAGKGLMSVNIARIDEHTNGHVRGQTRGLPQPQHIQDQVDAGLERALHLNPHVERVVWFDQPRDCWTDGGLWVWLGRP
jgi:hypothetical protein